MAQGWVSVGAKGRPSKSQERLPEVGSSLTVLPVMDWRQQSTPEHAHVLPRTESRSEAAPDDVSSSMRPRAPPDKGCAPLEWAGACAG